MGEGVDRIVHGRIEMTSREYLVVDCYNGGLSESLGARALFILTAASDLTRG